MNRIVNVRKEPCDIYMGRPWKWHKTCSPWQNPFHLAPGKSRTDVILEFAVYFYAPEQKWLREKALNEIGPNATLGCWCVPFQCHVEIVVGYLEWKRGV